ncbi:hypothetical protein FRC09_010290 [Ceratobasidium sp. 395]|nr:hypothetical protein FRC09_010290 [Ceratobasidium sp. 395]
MTVLPYSIEQDAVTAHIYTDPTHSFSSKIAVLFLLHGHPSSARHMRPIVNGLFELTSKLAKLADSKQNFVIVTLDLKPEDKENELESDRLYRRQERMAEGVSALIDRLPSLLSPNHDKIFDTWMVAGVSLGAHAAWLAIDRGEPDWSGHHHKLNIQFRPSSVGLYTRNRIP